MPPKAVKTVREIIYYQYAKIISASSGFGKENYGIIMSKWKKLCSGELNWSSSVREWLKEREQAGNASIAETKDPSPSNTFCPDAVGERISRTMW